LVSDHAFNNFQEEYRVLNGEGDYIYVIDKGYVLRDPMGNVIRIIGALQDITEQKNAEAALLSSEKKYRELFESISASIFIWRLSDFQILEVNEVSASTYHFTREDLLEKSFLDIHPEEDKESVIHIAQEALLESNYSSTLTWRHLDSFGGELFVQITSNRIEYNGEACIMATVIDVTEKMRLETKLQIEKEQKNIEITRAVIAAQEKEKESIGRDLHDNINQILASSRLYLGLLLNKLPEHSDKIEQADDLINKAIVEVRSLSHTLIAPTIDDKDLLDNIDVMLHAYRQASDFKIKTSFEAFDQTNVSSELKLAIYRIIQEQMNNILKHAKASKVDVYLESDEDNVTLSVKDNGIGMDVSKKSTGVGLLNIRTRASVFNGKVQFESAPNQGVELKVIFTQEVKKIAPIFAN
jgi:PAS domain S-box-containing protein